MAQVRKFNTGGKTVKIGGYTIDSNNKEDIELLESMSMNPEYGGLARSVLSHLTNPDYNNTYEMYVTQDGRFVTSGELQEEKDKYMNKRLQKSTSKKPNWWNDTFAGRNKEAWARSGADFMSAFEALRSEKKEETGKDNRKKITGVYNIGDSNWVYDENDTWSINSPDNARALTQLQWLEEYFNASKEDREKYYDVSDLDPDELEGWLQLRAATGKPYDLSQFKAGMTRLADNDPFYQQYRWFGFNPGSKEEREEREAVQTKEKNTKTIKDRFKWEGAENDFAIDKNGNIIATEAFKEKLGLTGSGGYWFNDSWNKQHLLKYGSNPYSDLHKYILWNDGRLYTENDILPLLNNTRYYQYLNDYNARDAQGILKTWWEPEYDFETNSPFGYTMTDIDSPLTWDDQTGKSKNRSGKQLVSTKDVPVIEYWVPIPGDPFGRRERKYAYIDPETKEVSEDLTAFQLEQLKDKLGISKDAFGNFKYRDDVDFGQEIIDSLKQHKINIGNGWELWKDSRGDGNYWFGYGSGGTDPGLVRIPQTVYDLLNTTKAAGSDKTWWDQLQNNHSSDWNDYRSYLYDALLSLNTDPRTSDQIKDDLNWTDVDWSKLYFNRWNVYDRPSVGEALPEQYKWIAYWSKLVPLLDEIKKSSDYDQRSYFRNYPTGSSVLSERAGGILKFQSGGIKAKHNPKKESKKPTITKSNDKWTSADSWELAATAGDVIAAITTLIDPTNVGGAVASLGATAADFASDWKRDGFQWRDAGKAGLNLLMDVATLIPVAGDAIAVGRAAKAVKKMMPLLRTAIKLGAIKGISDTTIGLLNKVSNGEDLTLDDWRSIANTLNGAISFKRLGFKKSPTKKVTKTFGDLKSTDGKSIKLNQTALENIKKADPDLRLSETQEAIIAEHKKSYPADKDLSKEDILAKYEIPTKSESKKWYKPWDRNKVPDLGATKTTKEQLSTEELKEYNKNKSSFGKWWSGSGDLQQAYYKQMMLGEVPTVTKTVKQQYYDVPSGFGLRAPFVQKLVPKVKDTEWTIQQPRTFTIGQTVPGKKLKLNAYNWGLDAWNSNPQEQFAYHPVGYDNPAQYAPVLKKGGVLKAEEGLFINHLQKNYLEGYGTFNIPETKIFVPKGGYKDWKPPVVEKPSLYSELTDISKIKKPTLAESIVTNAFDTPLLTTSAVLAKDSSALIPETENEFLKAKRRIADAHYLRQKLAAAKQRRDAYAFYDKYADTLSQRHIDAPNIISNNRFIDFRSDAARRMGSQYLSTIDRFNNADSGITLAGKLSGLENWSKFDSGNNDNLAEAARKQDELSRQTRVQQNLDDTEARNQNNELLINSNLAELSGKFGADQTHTLTQAGIDDKKSVEIQEPLVKMGQLKAQNEQTAMAYEEKAAAAKDAETRKAYLNLANKVRSDKFYKTQIGSLGYYPYLVKKGGTLRPMHEQMLINNQKLVARAIEKINDNTMKILLKLLS